MKLRFALPLLLTASVLAQTKELTPAQKAAQANIHHETNFDTERKRALDLSAAHKDIDALPLCTELVRQDPADGRLAECRARGLMSLSGIDIGTPKYQKDHEEALAEFRRALDLGDDDNFVLSMIDLLTGKTGSDTPGYADTKVPAARAALNEGEGAFSRHDAKAAFAAYVKASDADPTYYNAKLFAGDACYQSGDLPCASEWFAKAIAIDPNRETAYRYWGDALYKAGKSHEAKEKFELAIVAEPFQRLSWNGLLQWAQLTHTAMNSLAIPRPKIDGKNISISVAPDAAPGELAAWMAYAGCRMGAMGKDAKGNPVSNGPVPPYSAELETKCLYQAADAASGDEKALSPGLRNLITLKHDGMIECWVRLNSTDQGATQGYTTYRNSHRDLLVAYLDQYVVHEGVRSQETPRLNAPK